MREAWVDDVLTFWFEEATPEQWFKKDDAFDTKIRQRFLPLYERLAEMPLAGLTTDAHTTLAAIVVFDQMPRNMFRGTPRMFATDARALSLAQEAVARGFDQGLTKQQRSFIYLPFEHSEDLAMQERCVMLMAGLEDAELLKWAEAHRVIIARFGRFPHRNATLGRVSTPEEIAFLKEPGSGF
jgi:uncharacterized protein (DUF924 family)